MLVNVSEVIAPSPLGRFGTSVAPGGIGVVGESPEIRAANYGAGSHRFAIGAFAAALTGE
jgi:hypothetical protein